MLGVKSRERVLSRWPLIVMAFIFGIASIILLNVVYSMGFNSTLGSGPYILLSTSLSMLLVSVGWFVSFHISQRKNTLDLIVQSIHSDRYVDSVELIDKKFPDGSVITAEELKDPDNQEVKEAAVYVLNYLEFMCLGIKNNDLSENVCKSYYKSGFKNFYYKTKPLIQEGQNNYSPLVWENFVHYTKKWNDHLS